MPIVNGKYKNPGWLDNQQPPISAENLNDISNTLENLDAQGGGGKRYASLVVGTSAAGWTAADCDYLCDGTADNVEIQAAMDALTAGGEIVLLNGTYYLDGLVQTKPYTLLRGCGAGTILKRNTAGGGLNCQALVALPNSSMRDLHYDGSGFPRQTGETRYDVVVAGGHIQDCEFWMCDDISLIVESGQYGNYVTGNDFSGGGIMVTSQRGTSIEGNVFFGGSIRGKDGAKVNISGNTGTTGFDIYLEDAGYGSVISDNANVYSIEITSTASDDSGSNGTSCAVSGNTLFAVNNVDPVITLGTNTRNIFVTGNLLIKWFKNPVPTIQDNGTDNIVKWNSTDTGGSGAASALVTLTAAGWANKQQTVTVQGVSANEASQLITPTPASASQAAYYGAGIRATGQAANSVTFTAENVPTSNLQVYVVVQEVS